MKTDIRLWQYLAEFFLEWEIFQTKFVQKIKTHFIFSVTLFWKFYEMWKIYCRTEQATDDNTKQ